MISGMPLTLGLRTRMWDPYVDVVFWATIDVGSGSSGGIGNGRCLATQLLRDVVRKAGVVEAELREGPERQGEAVGLPGREHVPQAFYQRHLP